VAGDQALDATLGDRLGDELDARLGRSTGPVVGEGFEGDRDAGGGGNEPVRSGAHGLADDVRRSGRHDEHEGELVEQQRVAPRAQADDAPAEETFDLRSSSNRSRSPRRAGREKGSSVAGLVYPEVLR